MKRSNNDVVVNFGSFTNTQWYLVEIEFDCQTNSHRARLDGGSWSSPWSDSSTDFSQLYMRSDVGTITDAYTDEISITSTYTFSQLPSHYN